MNYALAMLLALTVGLLVWHHYGMERVLELSDRTHAHVDVVDDRIMQGASVATLAHEGGAMRMRCQLSHKISWPDCKYMFFLSDTAAGIDLSQFDSVSLDLRFHGPGRPALRVMIMNFEPGISTINDWMSQKINEVSFDVPVDGVVTVPLRVFHTATWWTEMRKIPLAHTDMRMDNATRFEVMTDATAEAGQYVIDLRAVRFYGKWISQNHLLMILVGVWIAFAVTWPVLAAVQLRAQLGSSRKRLRLLGEINRALHLETRELAGQAHTDPLTGALNRQGLRAALMNTSSMLIEPMSVIFVDIDYFKRINDQHGHEVGDAVLRDFAIAVNAGIRSSDKLVRWGGEEFLIICPSTALEQARALAEKLRLALPDHQWPAGLHVTSSFGVAARFADEEIGAVIKRADSALYRAKANGRDRVEVALPDLLIEQCANPLVGVD